MSKAQLLAIDPNKLYPIWYNETYGIIAGVWDGRQVMVKFQRDSYLVLSFSAEGELESVRPTPYTTEKAEEQSDIKQRVRHEAPIRVKRFFLEDHCIGIQPLSSGLQEMLDEPSEFGDEEEESQHYDL